MPLATHCAPGMSYETNAMGSPTVEHDGDLASDAVVRVNGNRLASTDEFGFDLSTAPIQPGGVVSIEVSVTDPDQTRTLDLESPPADRSRAGKRAPRSGALRSPSPNRRTRRYATRRAPPPASMAPVRSSWASTTSIARSASARMVSAGLGPMAIGTMEPSSTIRLRYPKARPA